MIGLFVSLTGVLVAGLAAILGVWMERDKESHLAWSFVFSSIILAATGVELVHTVYQDFSDGAKDEQMAFLLERLSDLSANNPQLEQLVAAEMAVQSRANPAVMNKMERNARAAGRDPDAIRQRAADSRRAAAGLTPASRPTRPAGAPAGRPAAGGASAPPKTKAPADQAGDDKAKSRPPGGEAGAAALDGAKAAGGKPAEAAEQVEAAAEQVDAAKEQATKAADAAKDKAKDAGKALDDAKDALPGLGGSKGGGGGGGGGAKGGGGGGGGGGSKPKIPGL